MKTRILIIEDNYCKYFTTKQVLESQLKLDVQVVGVKSDSDLIDMTDEFKPDVILYRPHGGVVELLSQLKKRRVNRRNTEVQLVVTSELNADTARHVGMMQNRRVAKAA